MSLNPGAVGHSFRKARECGQPYVFNKSIEANNSLMNCLTVSLCPGFYRDLAAVPMRMAHRGTGNVAMNGKLSRLALAMVFFFGLVPGARAQSTFTNSL